MATNANWTIVFEDKKIIKQSGDAAGTAYTISDDSFWSDSKFSNIWAIQHRTSVTSDEVEYRDETAHSSYADANIGDISQFSSKWDLAHLAQLQSNWDNDNVVDSDGNSTETEAEKITRLGARPTSYSS
jgi:hypothetical protein